MLAWVKYRRCLLGSSIEDASLVGSSRGCLLGSSIEDACLLGSSIEHDCLDQV